MTKADLPILDVSALDATKHALHAYSRVAGAWCKQLRRKRKHWWHSSLRPSVRGLTTGAIYGDRNFEIELDLVSGNLHVITGTSVISEPVVGQSSSDVARFIHDALLSVGAASDLDPAKGLVSVDEYAGYSSDQAERMHRTIGTVAAAMEDFRAGIREETSPIQFWPHHFDLSMIWLPGSKIPGQEPADEEYSDKQMNFGFVFGDEGIVEPYFYVTAYPLPHALRQIELLPGTTWRGDGFSGAVLLYRDFAGMKDPVGYLRELWSILLQAGQVHLATNE
jgi:hypothetical protein